MKTCGSDRGILSYDCSMAVSATVDVLAWDPRYDTLNDVQREGLEKARITWMETGGKLPATCGVLVKRGAWAGQPCKNPAGLNTIHEGYGRCFAHKGAWRRERIEGAWLMAHAFGQELNITPWEALLKAVRIAAGKVAYCEQMLRQASSDLEIEGRAEVWGEGPEAMVLDPDTRQPVGMGFRDRSFWVRKSEYWHAQLAKTAKMAIDAGVAERIVEMQILQVQLMARPLEAALNALDLPYELEMKAREAMRKELLALESEGVKIVDGEVVTGGTKSGVKVLGDGLNDDEKKEDHESGASNTLDEPGERDESV